LPAGATRADARALEAALLRRAIENASGRQPTRLIDEAITRWTRDAKTLKSYQKDLRYRLDVVRGYTPGKTLDELPDVAERIKANGSAAGLSPAAVNRYLAILRRLGNLAEKWGWTDKPLGRRIEMMPGEQARHVYLTAEEVGKLADAARLPIVRDFIVFAALTGLRRSEILGLRIEQIRGGAVMLDAHTKSGKPRIVPLPVEAVEIAAQRVPWALGAPLLNKVFCEARKAVAMPHVRLHDLRHTYASWLAQDGASMAAIRDLLGHSSLSVTSRYAHLARPDLEEVTKGLRVRRGVEDSTDSGLPPEKKAANA
jgi:integrase